VTIEENCLTCANFIGCQKDKKGRDYVCKKWKEIKSTMQMDEITSLILPSHLVESRAAGGESGSALSSFVEEDDSALEKKLTALLEEAMSSTSTMTRDYRIDDRDIKEYPNFYSFCTSKGGLNIKPFPRQLWVIVTLLAECCPNCTTQQFKNLATVPVKEPDLDGYVNEYVTFFEYGKCPKCGLRKSKAFRKKNLNVYIALAACIGQRAGKSMTLAMLATYITHKLLKLPKPALQYGLLPNTLLASTFVGLTHGKAVELLWTPFLTTVEDSPWFKDYHEMLKYYGDKNGDEYLKMNQLSIMYKHKNLLFHPSGPSKRTLRGNTRLVGIVDEIGWFPNEENDEERERQSANEVYTALDNSLMTVRTAALERLAAGEDNIVIPLMACISSPSSYRDKIMMLVKSNVDSVETLAVHLPTWQFNPNMPKKAFKENFKANPVRAERDFGANPPTNDSPFFSNEERVEGVFGPKKNQVLYKYTLMTAKRTQAKMKTAQIQNMVAIPKRAPSLLAIDAGQSNNSFALTVMHKKDGTGIRGHKYNVDAVMEIQPDYKRNTLNFARIYQDVIKPLVKHFNVKAVVADRWQSTKFLHDLEDELRVATMTYSLNYGDLVDIRDYIEDEKQQVYFPAMELTPQQVAELDITTDYPRCFKYRPMSHLYFQMLTIQDTGNAVIKGQNLTDDLFRSLACGLAFLMDEEFCAEYLVGDLERGPSGGAQLISRSGINPFDPIGTYSGGSQAVIPNLGVSIRRSR